MLNIFASMMNLECKLSEAHLQNTHYYTILLHIEKKWFSAITWHNEGLNFSGVMETLTSGSIVCQVWSHVGQLHFKTSLYTTLIVLSFELVDVSAGLNTLRFCGLWTLDRATYNWNKKGFISSCAFLQKLKGCVSTIK